MSLSCFAVPPQKKSALTRVPYFGSARTLHAFGSWTLHNYASETTWPLREGEGAIEKDKSFPNVCDVGGRLRVRLLVPWQEHFRQIRLVLKNK